jgi:hypothetical protein
MRTLLYAVTVYDLHMTLESTAWYWVLPIDVLVALALLFFWTFHSAFREVVK